MSSEPASSAAAKLTESQQLAQAAEAGSKDMSSGVTTRSKKTPSNVVGSANDTNKNKTSTPNTPATPKQSSSAPHPVDSPRAQLVAWRQQINPKLIRIQWMVDNGYFPPGHHARHFTTLLSDLVLQNPNENQRCRFYDNWRKDVLSERLQDEISDHLVLIGADDTEIESIDRVFSEGNLTNDIRISCRTRDDYKYTTINSQIPTPVLDEIKTQNPVLAMILGQIRQEDVPLTEITTVHMLLKPRGRLSMAISAVARNRNAVDWLKSQDFSISTARTPDPDHLSLPTSIDVPQPASSVNASSHKGINKAEEQDRIRTRNQRMALGAQFAHLFGVDIGAAQEQVSKQQAETATVEYMPSGDPKDVQNIRLCNLPASFIDPDFKSLTSDQIDTLSFGTFVSVAMHANTSLFCVSAQFHRKSNSADHGELLVLDILDPRLMGMLDGIAAFHPSRVRFETSADRKQIHKVVGDEVYRQYIGQYRHPSDVATVESRSWLPEKPVENFEGLAAYTNEMNSASAPIYSSPEEIAINDVCSWYPDFRNQEKQHLCKVLDYKEAAIGKLYKISFQENDSTINVWTVFGRLCPLLNNKDCIPSKGITRSGKGNEQVSTINNSDAYVAPMVSSGASTFEDYRLIGPGTKCVWFYDINKSTETINCVVKSSETSAEHGTVYLITVRNSSGKKVTLYTVATRLGPRLTAHEVRSKKRLSYGTKGFTAHLPSPSQLEDPPSLPRTSNTTHTVGHFHPIRHKSVSHTVLAGNRTRFAVAAGAGDDDGGDSDDSDDKEPSRRFKPSSLPPERGHRRNSASDSGPPDDDGNDDDRDRDHIPPRQSFAQFFGDATSTTKRDIHPYIKSPTAFARGSSTLLSDAEIPFGSNWRHNTVSQVLDVEIDPKLKTIGPWKAKRMGNITICWAVPFVQKYFDYDYFMSHFVWKRPITTHTMTEFYKYFPIYEGKSDRQMLEYYIRVLQHCMDYGFFVAPPQTITEDDIMGMWFYLFPQELQAKIYASEILYKALSDKKTKLLEHDLLGDIISTTDNGYDILREVLVQASHPGLVHSSNVNIPRQQPNDTIAEYFTKLKHYALTRSFEGTFLSDRYFLETFIRNMHKQHSDLSQALQKDFTPYMQKNLENEPLPADFSPNKLISTLHQLSRHVCGNSLLVTQTPYQLHRKHKSISTINRLSQSLSPFLGQLEDDEPPLSSTELDALMVHAVDVKSCFLCGDPNHVLVDCKSLKRIQDNPQARRIIRRALNEGQNLSSTVNLVSTDASPDTELLEAEEIEDFP